MSASVCCMSSLCQSSLKCWIWLRKSEKTHKLVPNKRRGAFAVCAHGLVMTHFFQGSPKAAVASTYLFRICTRTTLQTWTRLKPHPLGKISKEISRPCSEPLIHKNGHEAGNIFPVKGKQTGRTKNAPAFLIMVPGKGCLQPCRQGYNQCNCSQYSVFVPNVYVDMLAKELSYQPSQ